MSAKEIEYPLYTVDADPETGEWIGEPVDTGETVTKDWLFQPDGDEGHRDTYEHEDETRAIWMRWVYS